MCGLEYQFTVFWKLNRVALLKVILPLCRFNMPKEPRIPIKPRRGLFGFLLILVVLPQKVAADRDQQ